MKKETSLVKHESADIAAPRELARELLENFLGRRSPATRKAYAADLRDFSEHTGGAAEGTLEAILHLVGSGRGGAHSLMLKYKRGLLERGKSPRTINRRISTLRSAVKMARLMGLVEWTLEVEGEKVAAYRDTRGPGRAGFLRLLAGLGDRKKDVRDRALLRLLYDLGLRRGEAASLDLEDVDLERGVVAILGKGRTEKEELTLPPHTSAALAAWIKARGGDPGPLFPHMDRGGRCGGRITGGGVWEIVRRLGERTGIRVRPHGLRHAGITEALDLTGGNIRAVQRFSRHRDLRTLLYYDDNREDLGGKVSRMVSEAAGE